MAPQAAQSEPFPSFSPDDGNSCEKLDDVGNRSESRRPSASSHLSQRNRTRTSSLLQSFVQSNPPLGMWQATCEVGSKIPTLPEIRNGAFADGGWTHEGQMERRGTNPHEIHRRRMERTSSASTRTRKSSMSAGPGAQAVIVEERHEYFPRRASRPLQEPLAEEAATTQPQGQGTDIQHAREYVFLKVPIHLSMLGQVLI